MTQLDQRAQLTNIKTKNMQTAKFSQNEPGTSLGRARDADLGINISDALQSNSLLCYRLDTVHISVGDSLLLQQRRMGD